MTRTPTPSADEIWAILRETAAQQQRFQQESHDRFTRIEQQQAATQQQIDRNARAIAETRQIADANLQAISQLRAENRASIEDLVTTLTTYAEQAERDRLALSAEVRSLVNALRNRFDGNGHAGNG